MRRTGRMADIPPKGLEILDIPPSSPVYRFPPRERICLEKDPDVYTVLLMPSLPPCLYTTQFTFLFIYLLLPHFFSINLFFNLSLSLSHTHTHTHTQPTIHSLSSSLSLNLPFSLPSSLTPSASHLLLSETLSERTLSRYGLAQWSRTMDCTHTKLPNLRPQNPASLPRGARRDRHAHVHRFAGEDGEPESLSPPHAERGMGRIPHLFLGSPVFIVEAWHVEAVDTA